MQPVLLPTLEGMSLSGQQVRLPADLPAEGRVLVLGYTHGARQDVARWKAALRSRGLPFLSLPTASVDTEAVAMAGVAAAMRAHVPEAAWEGIVQVHKGGAELRRAFGWHADDQAKVLWVTAEGVVRARHDAGPFSESAVERLLSAGAGS